MSTYINPLAGKAVALMGRFKAFKIESAIRVLEQMGAIMQYSVVNETDIVMVGTKPGKKFDRVVELGIEQWDEAKLGQAFADYNEHLQQQPSASHFDPLIQTFELNEARLRPIALYGLPIARQAHQIIIGSYYAYLIDMNVKVDIWDYDGLDTLQAIVIQHITDEGWEAFTKQLDQLTNLKALVINDINGRYNMRSPIDVEPILAALPQLESLFLSSCRSRGHSTIRFNVTRHSNLQQLCINANSISGLPLVSLPKLRYLNIEENTLNDVLAGMSVGAYPLLNAIHVFDPDDCIAILKQIPALPQISHLTLSSRMWERPVSEEIIAQLIHLAEWQGTRHLTHLGLNRVPLIELAALKREDFPLLTHLQLQYCYHDRGRSAVPALWEGLHITLSQGWSMDEEMVEPFVATLQALPPLASLTISRPLRTFTPEEQSLFASLPYPVQIDNIDQ